MNTQFYSPAGCDVVVWRKTAAEEKKRQKCQEEIFKCWKQDLISEIPKTLVLIISLRTSPHLVSTELASVTDTVLLRPPLRRILEPGVRPDDADLLRL